MDKKLKLFTGKLADERSRKVMFVSHCILNENVRYLGGAFRKNGVNEIIDELQKQGIGIVQMKCPEQMAWGGVQKRYLLFAYGLKNSMPLAYALRKPLISLFLWHTKRKYRKLAKQVASEIEDYFKSGFDVVGILGIDGSPSCGVNKILDFEKSFEYLASIDVENLKPNKMNAHLYRNCISSGNGFFIAALKKELQKRDIKIRFYKHDLVSELNGRSIRFKL
jgi:predicted secreted protein